MREREQEQLCIHIRHNLLQSLCYCDHYSVGLISPHTAPATPPDITVRRLNPTDVEVNWVPLSPEESQGIITSYLVRFRITEEDPIGSSRRSRRNSDDLTTVVETNDPPPLVVSDLDPRIVYAVAIAARNGAGIGSYGPETIVGCECIVTITSALYLYYGALTYKILFTFTVHENSLFQLHMSGTISCNFWLVRLCTPYHCHCNTCIVVHATHTVMSSKSSM